MLAIEKRLTSDVRTALETELRLTGTMHMIQTELQNLYEQNMRQKADGGLHGHGNGGLGGRHGDGEGGGCAHGGGRQRHQRGFNSGGGGMQRQHPMRNQHAHSRRGVRQQGGMRSGLSDYGTGFERRGTGEDRSRSRNERRNNSSYDDIDHARQLAPTIGLDNDHTRIAPRSSVDGMNWSRTRRPTHGTKGDSFFQKEFRLILNSLIETNQDDIFKRIGILCRKHLLEDAQDNEAREATVEFVASALIQAAQLQALYSSQYVAIVHYLCTKVFVDEHKETYGIPLEMAIRTHCYEREIDNLSKLQAKGYAKFVTHLYLAGIADHKALESWAQRIICAAKGPFEQIASELLVWFCLELATFNEATKTNWKAFVTEHVGPLWADDGPLGMRARIRLLDVRDTFELT